MTRFGASEAVEFHKSFFVDTFGDWRPPRLICLWMDVDLEVSAPDLMVVADQLSPDNPIPPMLARHEELGRTLTGRFNAGYTGAFWPRQGGMPIMDTEVLIRLVQKLP